MKTFYEFWNIIEDTAPSAAAPSAEEIYKQIEKAIDQWETETIESMKTQTKNFKQPSLWQRFKGGVQNMVYGRKHPNNPMVNKNAYGHGWGQNECAEKIEALFESTQKEIDDFFLMMNEERNLAIHELQIPRETLDSISVNSAPSPAPAPAPQNLKIFNFIKGAAQKLKQTVKNILMPAVAPDATAPAPAPPPTT